MYINTGYLNHSHKDFKDKSRPLIVGSCGTYRLSQHPKMPTYRPREDWITRLYTYHPVLFISTLTILKMRQSLQQDI